jgi:hypothetical protein
MTELVLQPPPDLLTEHWQLTVNRADRRALALYERHYSAYQYADERERNQFVSPGQYVALMTATLDALFVWHRSLLPRRDKQEGVNCAVFRNEGDVLSSTLILEAMTIAQQRWGLTRLFTYVNGDKVRSTNPGYCFRKALWEPCGKSSTGLLIFEWLP